MVQAFVRVNDERLKLEASALETLDSGRYTPRNWWNYFHFFQIQAEEEYNEAKSVYTKLHAELYEELPALFDR